MLRVLVLLASVLGLVSGHPLGAQTCDPAGDVKFVCGTTNPEGCGSSSSAAESVSAAARQEAIGSVTAW